MKDAGALPRQRMSIAERYARFVAVGSAVAAATIVVREGLVLFLGDRTPVAYSTSVVLAYGIGILINFRLQTAFTFRKDEGMCLRVFSRFVLVACFGAVVTWACAFALRYGTSLDTAVGSASGTVAFAVGCFAASFTTFALNARYVFPAGQ